ncbi:hypothetical protein LTR56_024684 [Elasticomyces elasticus]|nr:hypothetical protein LTR56_024684 [Elasticomyces elasticus]KAK3622201.1 hypothetical protein LTR22_024903 [Elasticomyces elasticus]KAK4907810.1 hypothetical protein LTR49_023208 [Elasticomyces elasticus]KAK5747973.1 hypothetical protein LTS12_021969 [Elasticomyces elasticus]
MPVDWAMAAVPAAVAIFVVPHIAKALYGAATIVLKKKRQSRRLKWEDVPEGRVHACNPIGGPFQQCYHGSSGKHEMAKSCWESSTSVATVFNRAWKDSPKSTSDLPEVLPLGSSYLCTDAETVLAFMLCSTSGKRDRNPGSSSSDKTEVVLDSIGRVVIAHVQGNFQPERQQLTKRELSCILRDVSFPMMSEADIVRGGWIVAVGLMDLRQNSQTPLGLWTCPKEPANPGFRRNGVRFRLAVARCRDHIIKNIAPHFPGNQYVLDAIKAFDSLVTTDSGSGMPTGSLEAGPSIPHLRSSDCAFLCKVFNEYHDISAQDRTRLEPILLPTMSAAAKGACEVIEYLKDVGLEMKVPPDLQPFDREVWLRDCTTKLPTDLLAQKTTQITILA